jgi:hypothetical protein
VATPFSRSIRSIQADSGKLTILGVIFSSLLLLAWGIWFLGSGITVNQVSTDIEIGKHGDVFAYFAPNHATKIRIGQKAKYHFLNTGEDANPVIPGQVMDVSRDFSSGKTRVKISQEPGFYNFQVEEDSQLEIAIEVEEISPAVLLLEKTGLISRDNHTIRRTE